MSCIVPGRWIAFIVITAIAAALLARRSSRAAMALTAPLLVVHAMTAFVASLGH